jgi:hypothetical protein
VLGFGDLNALSILMSSGPGPIRHGYNADYPKDEEPRLSFSRLLKNRVLRANFLMFAGRTTELMGRDRRCMSGVGCGFASYSTLQTDSSHCGEQFRDANEIVSDRGQDEEPFHQTAPAMPGFTQTADGLNPAKRLRLIVLMR